MFSPYTKTVSKGENGKQIYDDFKLLFMASDLLFLNTIAGKKVIIIAFRM